MKKVLKRGLSLLLTVMMTTSLLTTTCFAADKGRSGAVILPADKVDDYIDEHKTDDLEEGFRELIAQLDR